MQQDKADDQQIELCCEFNLEIENEEIVSDYPRLFQVMLGLQSNALKYTQTGYVRHIVSIEEDPKTGSSSLNIIIEDTGLGIEKD